jgi:hypothetical protein
MHVTHQGKGVNLYVGGSHGSWCGSGNQGKGLLDLIGEGNSVSGETEDVNGSFDSRVWGFDSLGSDKCHDAPCARAQCLWRDEETDRSTNHQHPHNSHVCPEMD